MSLANKGEADRCIELAKKSLAQGNIKKAEKFLNKSIRLYPLPEATAILNRITNPPKAQSQSPSQSQSQSQSQSFQQNASQQRTGSANSNNNNGGPKYQNNYNNDRQNYNPPPSASASASASSLPSSHRRPTRSDEVDIVKRVLRSKDYYAILGVPRNVEEKPLKKAFRSIAKKLHPDKNHAPGATEAFKKLSKAYDCLRDTQQRAIYDQYGADSPQMKRHGHPHQFQQMTPDDILRMFFGGDFGGGRSRSGFSFHTQRSHNHGHAQQPQGPVTSMGYLIQLLPLIFVFLTMILPSLMMYNGSSGNNSGGASSSASGLYGNYYTFEAKGKFTLPRKTGLGTEYFVSHSRMNEWRYNIRKASLEKEVESKYLEVLTHACDLEMNDNNVELAAIISNGLTHKSRIKKLKRMLKRKRKYEQEIHYYQNGIRRNSKFGQKCKKLFEYMENVS